MSAEGTRRPPVADDRLVVVRVEDAIDPALTGSAGARYESPPQPEEDGLALVRPLLGRPAGLAEDCSRWTVPLAGGRRTVTLEVVTSREPKSPEARGKQRSENQQRRQSTCQRGKTSNADRVRDRVHRHRAAEHGASAAVWARFRARSGSAKVRVVRGPLSCRAARRQIAAAYRAEDTRSWSGYQNPDGVFWRVDVWRWFIELAGSQTFCHRGAREVDGSLRSDDGWKF